MFDLSPMGVATVLARLMPILPFVVVVFALYLYSKGRQKNKKLWMESLKFAIALVAINLFVFFWFKTHDTSEIIAPLIALGVFYVVFGVWVRCAVTAGKRQE